MWLKQTEPFFHETNRKGSVISVGKPSRRRGNRLGLQAESCVWGAVSVQLGVSPVPGKGVGTLSEKHSRGRWLGVRSFQGCSACPSPW